MCSSNDDNSFLPNVLIVAHVATIHQLAATSTQAAAVCDRLHVADTVQFRVAIVVCVDADRLVDTYTTNMHSFVR